MNAIKRQGYVITGAAGFRYLVAPHPDEERHST
jgi:hypothetical protein